MATSSFSSNRVVMWHRALDVLLVVAATVTLSTLAWGRIEIDLLGVHVRASQAWRPLALLAIVGVVWWRAHRAGAWPEILARLGFAAFLATWVLTCINFGDRACGGLDSSGYVGASALLASGTLTKDQPIARLLPFPEAAQAAAPLGFVVGRDGHSRVPRFPLGLPLVMAAFRALGPGGPFWVPLVMAVLTLAAAYRLGRTGDETDGVSALFAASLVAVSPTFFNGAIQPMSDVSATFWILAATWLSIGGSPRPIGTGLTAGMAVLTRPVLLPAALTIMGLLAWRCRPTASARSNLARLAAGVLIFAALLVAQAGLNTVLYGSPVGTGYGTPADLLHPARVLGNLVSYASWITRSHSVLFWIAWAAGLVVLRGRGWPAMFSLVAAAAIAPYLFYFTFDDWESTRFVLPALALALIVGARGVDAALARYARRWRPLLLLAGILVCATASHQFLARRFVFDLWRGESKYPRVGQWVRERTPPGAVIVSSLHSGSIHYYSGRDIVRWDVIPARMLAPSVGSLSSHGHAVYLALDEPSEAGPFDARFRDDLAVVSMIPLDRVGDVLLYELTCRASDPRCQMPE